MASTFSTNNGFERIATGEQSGTWGETTNENFDLLDEALDGQVTITLGSAGSSGAPNSLSIADGASSNGRHRFVRFTDSANLGATAFVQLNPNDAEKIYFVENALSGSQSISFFQGTYNAGRAYVLPAGERAILRFDGAGATATCTVIAQLKATLGTMATQNASGVAITGGTVAGVTLTSPNATITGGTVSGITDLAVTDGGTGASTAASARTNLGVAIGSDVQGWSARLDQMAASAPSLGAVIVGNGTAWVAQPTSTTGYGVIPPGGIIMWSGSVASIPAGWALCNGSNGTPDLRDRFVVGAGTTYTPGNTGGSATVALVEADLPSHTHTASPITVSTDSGHTHTAGTYGTSTASLVGSVSLRRRDGTVSIAPSPAGIISVSEFTGGNFSRIATGNGDSSGDVLSINATHSHTLSGTSATGGSHNHTLSGNTGATGSGTAHENRPPYYALAFIMKL